MTKPRPASPRLSRAALAALVLDGVLEVRHGGRFLGGAAAHHLFFREAAPLPASRLACRSVDAVRQLAEAEPVSVPLLAATLYRFNAIPLTPQWREQFPHPAAVEQMLLRAAPRPARLIGPEHLPGGAWSDGWLGWRARAASGSGDTAWKLYVSPAPGGLRDALHASLRTPGLSSLKVGRDLANILRPDKLVLYFDVPGAMRQAARYLDRALAGMAAHGVPFTAQIGESELLSWGVDIAPADPARRWAGEASWRSRVTRLLASALAHAARESGHDVPAWRFALDRLSLAGVNIRTFAPARRGGMPGPCP